jgi:hypothetical protein
MLREDKHVFARTIVERAYAVGAMGGSFLYGVLFLLGSMRLALFIFTFIMAFLLLAYPMITLMYTSNHPTTEPHDIPHGKPLSRQEDPFTSHVQPDRIYVEPMVPYAPEQNQQPLYRPVPHQQDANQPMLYRPDLQQHAPHQQQGMQPEPYQPDPYETSPDKYLPPFENTKPAYHDPDDKDRGGWV